MYRHMYIFTLCIWLKFVYLWFERPNICHTRTTAMWLEITLMEGEQGGYLGWGTAARRGQLLSDTPFLHSFFFPSCHWWCRDALLWHGDSGCLLHQGVSLIVTLLPHTHSHCGNEPYHFFWFIHLNTSIVRKKTNNKVFKSIDFQHAFISLESRICFIIINLLNAYGTLGSLLYLPAYLIMITPY